MNEYSHFNSVTLTFLRCRTLFLADIKSEMC